MLLTAALSSSAGFVPSQDPLEKLPHPEFEPHEQLAGELRGTGKAVSRRTPSHGLLKFSPPLPPRLSTQRSLLHTYCTSERLPDLLADSWVRRAIELLPVVEVTGLLRDDRERRRALLLFSALAS